MKKPFTITCLAVTALVLLLIGFGTGSRFEWVGCAILEVRLQSRTGRKVDKVSFDSMMFRQWTDDFRKDGDPLSLRPLEDFDGAHGTLCVRSSGTSSGGRELRYVRDELVVLEIIYADGDKRLEVAEVPERGQPQVVEITIP
jgi:hypothetical protein